MSRYLVASAIGFIVGILLGATLGSSHVYSPPAALEDDDVQPWDERTVTLASGEGSVSSAGSVTSAAGSTERWAT